VSFTLRELTSDQQAILAQVESGDFTLGDVSDHLELLESERNKKIENYLHVINNLETKLKSKTDEIKRIEAMRDADANALANIKSWLLMSMKDGEKHEFDLFKVSRVKGREVVSIIDDDKIPTKYSNQKITYSVDKRQILADLKAGVKIDGAEITTGNPSLRIK
jgi:hypothetical protein